MEPGQHNERFADPGDTIYSLMAGEVLIECPRCAKCASHKQIELHIHKRDWFAPRRLVCAHCGLAREWHKQGIAYRWRETPARDDYFNEILWIRAAFRAHEIWAYNWRHLELIEKYVAAFHRQHVRSPDFGWANKGFVNRLPTWITSAKNRDDVLVTIASLKRERNDS